MQGPPPETALANQELWPLAVYALAACLIVASVFVLSALIGPRHRARRRDLPYESGMPATGRATIRFPVHFYLVALAFLIFDLEAAFLFAWAVSAREVGWLGYVELVVFAIVLLAGLVYLWGKGALEWGASPARSADERARGSET